MLNRSQILLTVLRDVLLLLAVVVFAWRPAALPVAALRDGSALAVPLLALAATALGFWNARRTAAVKHVDVPIANLPAALHGFTVAQITDVHVGPTIKRGYLQAIVDRARPNARILWRSAGFQVDFVDPIRVQRAQQTRAVGDLLEYRTELAQDCHRRDRVHTYGSFYIADMRL